MHSHHSREAKLVKFRYKGKGGGLKAKMSTEIAALEAEIKEYKLQVCISLYFASPFHRIRFCRASHVDLGRRITHHVVHNRQKAC